MIKVFCVTEEGRGGGALKRMRLMSTALREEVAVTIVTPKTGKKYLEKLTLDEVSFIPLSLHPMTRQPLQALVYLITFIPEVLSLYFLIRKHKPDLIHCNGAWQIKGVMAAKMSGTKSIWHMNDMYQPKLVLWLFRKLSGLPDAYIYASNRTKKYYKLHQGSFSQIKKAVIPAPVDTYNLEPLKGVSKIGPPRCVTLGYINRNKGIELLIETAALYKDHDIIFDIAGGVLVSQEGYKKELDAKIRSLGVEKKINFLGHCDIDAQFFANYTFYLCTSRYESSPMALLEAMSCGLPVVSTDVGDVALLLEQYNFGYVCKEHLAKALKEEVDKMLQIEDGDRKSMGQKAREAALSIFSIENLSKDYIRFYSSVKKLKICLVNRNYPPLKGATGFHAKHFINYAISETQHSYEIVSIAAEETGAKEGIEEIAERRHWVKGVYGGKSKWKRLIGSIVESYRLIKKAKKTKADVYIIMTDPPFLNYMAARLLKGTKVFFWTMDLYPEAFAANQLVSKNNVFFKQYKRTLKRFPLDGYIALGERQAEYLKEAYDAVSIAVLPIGISGERKLSIQRERRNPKWTETDHLIFAYIGTVGEAHDEVLIRQVIEKLIGKKYNVILSLKGSRAASLTSSLKDKEGVHFVDFVPYRHFRFIDVQIVSLLPSWLHVSVPSKAISAVEYGNALLYLGDSASDTWQMLEEVSWHIENESSIEAVLDQITRESLSLKKERTEIILQDLIDKREHGYKKIIQAFDNLKTT